ncbi:hypothetical protein DPSP01_013615 [Paraphaeosphaeria sporulosa]
MRWSSSLCILSSWFLNISNTCPLGDREDAHATTLQARDNTFWRRVRIGGGLGADNSAGQISDVFTVGDSSTPGGCSAQMNTVNAWLKDAITLQDAIVKAYSNYKSDKGLRQTWEFIFGIEFDGNDVDMDDLLTKMLWPAIGKRIAGVTQYLEKAASFKPWIFCSEMAGSLQQWDQPIKDKNGKEIASKLGPDGKPEDYYTLRQVFQTQASTPDMKAFYMEAFKGYDFYTNKYNSLCGDGNRYAATSRYIDRAAGNPLVPQVDITSATRNVIFCPTSFSPPNGGQHSFPSLSMAVSSGYYPPYGGDWNIGQPNIEKYIPVSGTFYHELYHLTDVGDTADPYRHMIHIYMAARQQAANNADNPESYLYMAMATYMFLNPPQGKDAVLFPAGVPKKASDVK